MLAILSDVHGNLEALHAVLEDIARHRVETIYCLGDTVGYGPDPCACLDLVAQTCIVVLLGNHDRAALTGPVGFRERALRALLWTQEQLEAPDPNEAAAVRRRDFLASRPDEHTEGRLLFVHASPRNPLDEYVFPEDVADRDRMADLFALVEGCCFQGHTHKPGVFTEHRPGVYRFAAPESYRLNGSRAMVNVGAVGQPRDGDWRACYALFDGETVCFRRLEYDVAATVAKMRALGLDESLADRLYRGR
jgi:diadenosine tetraphosphatase ApaH/serine/threonine PP2A family protein phosphatase